MNDLLKAFDEYLTLTAESGILHPRVTVPRAIVIETRRQELHHRDRPLFDYDGASKVLPLYHSVDDGEVVGAYITEDVSDKGIALGLLTIIACSSADEAALPMGAMTYEPTCWQNLVHLLGCASVPLLMAALDQALASRHDVHVRYELEEWPCDDQGEEIVGEGRPPLITAPIDSCDERFVECSFTTCDAEDADARRVTRFAIDTHRVAALRALVNERTRRARLVLRGED